MPKPDTSTHDAIVLENDFLRLEFSPVNGTILQVEHKSRAIQLVRFPTDGPPWRVELEGQADWIEAHSAFSWAVEDDGLAVALQWDTTSGMRVEARVELPAGDPLARFSIRVIAAPDQRIDKIEYPILRGIGNLDDDMARPSVLAHSHTTGFLFHRPYHLFEREPIHRQGLRYSPYPEGFSGSSMQFMAYYAEGHGGFYFAAHDPTKAMKWLNFFKGPTDTLECTFIHQSPDIRTGQPFNVPYPISIGALDEGNWYEAAERYKSWAVDQSWTAQGPLRERTDVCRWLLDDVGFATFGVNAAHDRAAWLEFFHTITDEPVFHVLGVNWPKGGGDYRGNHPGGREEWFPARFDRENLATIRRNGDRWAPFEFDLLLNPNGADGETITAALQHLPAEKLSLDPYNFPFVCPATDFLPPFHRWRDERLAGEHGADALYYDISANNVLMTCRAPDHGHPVGGGGWLVDAYAAMWAATKEAASAAKGEYVPQGAEMVNEAFIPYLDFYQARAEASPLSAFEADRFREWIRQGQAEKIPLFAYVYHEYGPVRLDGWAKLSPQVGELFYWVAARVALWGGLFELNYEFSPLESLDGRDDNPAEHYYDFEARSFEIDPAKVAFVREVALARTGFAKPYLVYGSMIRPLAFTSAEIELDYFLYNVGRDRPHYEEAGSLRVASVVHAAWRSGDGRLGFVFANLLADQSQTVTLEFDPAQYGIPPDSAYQVERITSTDRASIARSVGQTPMSLALESRRLVLVEITPQRAPD